MSVETQKVDRVCFLQGVNLNVVLDTEDQIEQYIIDRGMTLTTSLADGSLLAFLNPNPLGRLIVTGNLSLTIRNGEVIFRCVTYGN